MAIGYKVVKGSATKARARRHFRLRKRVSGTALRPRLVVSRSARHLFVQVVDDTTFNYFGICLHYGERIANFHWR